MTAPDLSPTEAAIVARFEAAPTPPEVLREQVARELWAADAEVDGDQLSGETPQRYYRLADAALAVFRDQQDPAVQRVEALTAAVRAVESIARVWAACADTWQENADLAKSPEMREACLVEMWDFRDRARVLTAAIAAALSVTP